MGIEVGDYKPGRGIPSARNIDHIAITVPDLDEAVRFFVEVLGCEIVYKLGPTEDSTGTWMQDRLNVPPASSLHFVMLRCGANVNLEVYQYSAPDQVRTIPRNCDWGACNVAFYVTDIDAAVEYLKAVPGVHFLQAPEAVVGGPIGTTRWVYFLTPWGMQMELVTYDKLPYEQQTSARQYGPADRWQNSGA